MELAGISSRQIVVRLTHTSSDIANREKSIGSRWNRMHRKEHLRPNCRELGEHRLRTVLTEVRFVGSGQFDAERVSEAAAARLHRIKQRFVGLSALQGRCDFRVGLLLQSGTCQPLECVRLESCWSNRESEVPSHPLAGEIVFRGSLDEVVVGFTGW